MKRNLHRLILRCSVGILLLYGCAKQGYPPGGPEDRTGPQVISGYPEPGSVSVPLDVRPWIELNEYPNRTTLANQVFISPEPEAGYTVKVKGKRVEVRFDGKLPENRTIMVTFSSGVSDLYGNKMSAPYVVAFSTGEAIDQGRISGRVAGIDNASSTWIWAYPLSEFPEPDPRKDKAPFAAQPDQLGNYELSYLPVGDYRLFAVGDLRRDRLWDSSKEPIGFASRDAKADTGQSGAINIKLGICDLDPPKLRVIEAPNRQLVRLSFNEPITKDSITISNPGTESPDLVVISSYWNPADSAAVLLTTAIQRPDTVYHLRIDGVYDLAGNRADSTICEFASSNLIDTIGPRLSYSDPAAGQGDVPLNATVTVAFNEAITLVDLPLVAHLSRPDSGDVMGKWSYQGTGMGIFTPAEPLLNDTHYSMQIRGDSLRDIFGSHSVDSLSTIEFTTLDAEKLGSLSGEVTHGKSELRVVAEGLGKSKIQREVSLLKGGQFRFDDLPEGKYQFWLYLDHDGNQRYSSGRFDPYAFAESFTLIPDTVRVRPRWETEGIILNWEGEP
ncbi:MAG: Ig-like domain-containing protein [bacterium]|nr:Ig-like domain-containing protein [bacterium]